MLRIRIRDEHNGKFSLPWVISYSQNMSVYYTYRLRVNRMRREKDARRPRKVRLKSGNSETHTREEQRSGRVKQDVAGVEPQRLEAWHLVVGSTKNNSPLSTVLIVMSLF